MLYTLLHDSQKCKVKQKNKPHINKRLEINVVSHLVVDTTDSDWVVGDVLHICIPEGQSSVKQSCYIPDHWMLIALYHNLKCPELCNVLKIPDDFDGFCKVVCV
jgi:hypothetical protein